MEISERKILLRIFDVIFVFAALGLLSIGVDFPYFYELVSQPSTILLLGIYINVFGTIFNMYQLQLASNLQQVLKGIFFTSVFSFTAFILTPILTPLLPHNRLQIMYLGIGIVLGLLFWRLIYLYVFSVRRFLKRVLFVGQSSNMEHLVTDLIKANPHYEVVGYVNPTPENSKDIGIPEVKLTEVENFIRTNRIAEVVIALNEKDNLSPEFYHKLLHCLENGIVIREYFQVYESSVNRIPVHYLSEDFYRYFPFSRNNQNKVYLIFNRSFDIISSFTAFIFLVLIIPFVFMLNLFFNKGPLFYKQVRVGKNRKPFTIYKFRTMVVDAEKQGAQFATKNDSRITAFGKILRKSRLDEFPQFINILRGEMSVIGPRPERPVFVEKIAAQMPFYQTRHIIKPGLTGWAQVCYSYGETIDDSLIKLQYDLFYIKHRSILLDVNIILKTIGTVLFYKGQ